MKADTVVHLQQDPELIQRISRVATVVGAAKVDDEAAIILQLREHFLTEGAEPVDVLVLLLVVITLLSEQGERRRSHDEADAAFLSVSKTV